MLKKAPLSNRKFTSVSLILAVNSGRRPDIVIGSSTDVIWQLAEAGAGSNAGRISTAREAAMLNFIKGAEVVTACTSLDAFQLSGRVNHCEALAVAADEAPPIFASRNFSTRLQKST